MRPFAYAVADSPAHAVQMIRDSGPAARFLAGGTTLYDLMKLGVELPEAIVDVSRIEELTTIDTGGDRELVIGAGARMADVAEDPVLRTRYPALAESLSKAASEQLRVMATVGGNLLQRTRCPYFRGGPAFPCNKRDPGSGCAAIGGADRTLALLGTSPSCIANYPGDWAVALLAFDAALDILGPDGERSMNLAELYREPGDRPDLEHNLAADEMITRIRIPVTGAGPTSTYHKIRDRESYAFALASAAVALDVADGVIRDARIALGGVASRPWRVPSAEQALTGTAATAQDARRAGELALQGARPGEQNEFRVELAIRTVADAVAIAWGRGR
ncbi:FAD binding domain-containing protein [Micromonospora sp. 067-2]|uniref:FAD binding domain-containing protein n=1 Tax=Micromonospora sp. 067-2 TaxID=2789270 RepID=UPI00397C5E25